MIDISFSELSYILQEKINANIYLFIIVIVIIDRIRIQLSKNYITSWIFIFPGVLLHELSHLLISFLLNGKPNKFVIFPKKVVLNGKNYIEYGYVESKNIRWYNRFLIGMSPLLIFFVIYLINDYIFLMFNDNLFTNLIFIYLVIVLTNSAIPSIVDFELAFKGYGYVSGILFTIFLYLLIDKSFISIFNSFKDFYL